MSKIPEKFSKFRADDNVTGTSGMARKYFIVNLSSGTMFGFRHNFRLPDIQKLSRDDS